MSRARQRKGITSSPRVDPDELKGLCERLLCEQPLSGPLLQRLLDKSRRMSRQSAFAPVQDDRCSACNMTIASAQLQKAKAGAFINCAHCSIFLYYR
jgi:hypothetical protein